MRTSAVRMSFTTDRPFFPYREPPPGADAAPSSRSLRIFFVGPERVTGAIGPGAIPWPHELEYAAPAQDLSQLLQGALPPGQLPGKAWVSAFVDKSSPRPGSHDLFFSPAGTAQEVHPEPVVHIVNENIPVPVECVLVVLALGGLAWWGVGRLRRKKDPREVPQA